MMAHRAAAQLLLRSLPANAASPRRALARTCCCSYDQAPPSRSHAGSPRTSFAGSTSGRQNSSQTTVCWNQRRGLTVRAAAESSPTCEGVVVVVGAGIIGLSTAQELLRRGYSVTVVAKSLDPSTTTSSVAAGFVFPYLLQPVSQCEQWVQETLALCRAPPRTELCHPMETYVLHIEHAVEEPEWGGCGLEYRRLTDGELAEFNEARPGWVAALDGFLVQTFCFNTGAYLEWLHDDITAAGARRVIRRLDSLMEVTTAGEEAFGGRVRAVVNCSGVYARDLVADESVRPVYGQVVSLAPQEGITRAYVIEDGSEILGGSAYMFPRRDKIICGGTAIADKWSEEPDEAITQGILERVSRLVPELNLRDVEIQPRCGLRPSRPRLRLELEAGHACGVPVVHSYGHGGSGWTVFVGAAREAADLVQSALGD